MINRIDLIRRCEPFGEITFTGSYFLNLMMYPDIDLYLPPSNPRDVLSLGGQLAGYDCVTYLNFQKGGAPGMDDALYLKPIIQYGDWSRPWKIDIWFTDQEVINEKHGELEDLRDRMTPEHRSLILNYKFDSLTDTGRTPMFSGLFIYRAVINEGLRERGAIDEYLRGHGISL